MFGDTLQGDGMGRFEQVKLYRGSPKKGEILQRLMKGKVGMFPAKRTKQRFDFRSFLGFVV